MEKIKINKVDVKPSGLVIVNYNSGQEATMNTKWQNEETSFIKDFVGVGGSVEVEIQQKGQYTNITKVNMKDNYSKPTEECSKIVEVRKKSDGMLISGREKSIIAQSVTKMAVEMCKGNNYESKYDFGKDLVETANEIFGCVKLVHSWL